MNRVCSQYVPHTAVTEMAFKVGSRVRGLSDEASRDAFGSEEQCRTALVRLRWPGGFVCFACGHRGHCELAGRGLYQCNSWRCWRAAKARSGSRAGWRWTTPISAAGAPAASGAGAQPARRPSWRRSRPGPRAPAQAQAGAGQRLPQARDRARRGAVAGAGKRGRHRRPRLLACARRGRLEPSRGSHRLGTQGCSCGLVQMGQYDPRQHQERDHRDLPQAWPRPCRALPRQFRLALQPALPPQDHDPPLPPLRRTYQPHALPNPHRWMRIGDKQEIVCRPSHAGGAGGGRDISLERGPGMN